MTFKIHTLSKKYGDTTFIFFIIVLTISQFFFQITFNIFLSEGSQMSLSSILLNYLHLIISLVTVHILIGTRLLFIRRHPIKSKEMILKGDFNNVNNLAKFIHIRKNANSTFSCLPQTPKNNPNDTSASIRKDSTYSTSIDQNQSTAQSETLNNPETNNNNNNPSNN
jgi:succinate dehydrogenase/fumarate reductase cytochrome b subunit